MTFAVGWTESRHICDSDDFRRVDYQQVKLGMIGENILTH